MKTLKCHRCGKEVGEIRKGRIRRNAVIFCGTCHKKLLLTNDNNKEPFDFFSRFTGARFTKVRSYTV